MKCVWKQYKTIILYLLFGVCTTLVNIVVYYFCAHPLKLSTVTSTCIAWIVSVIFAYITNRIWVFESKTTDVRDIIKEISSFVACRMLTGVLDLAIMFICVDLLGLNDLVIKILSNVIVVVLNYVASRLVIFRKS